MLQNGYKVIHCRIYIEKKIAQMNQFKILQKPTPVSGVVLSYELIGVIGWLTDFRVANF